MKDYRRVVADELLENDLRALVRLAIAEDLGTSIDWTTVCLIDAQRRGACQVVSRQPGICAGLVTVHWIVEEFDADLEVELLAADAQPIQPGTPLFRLSGNVRDLLTSERVVLNLISRLCGVATLTAQFQRCLAGTKARLYDTRKTTPGWRRLEKYAVNCGGAHNHRSGLYDGFLIKDNHLDLGGEAGVPLSPRVAAERAIAWRAAETETLVAPELVEIEVDSLDQLRTVLPAGPDIVLIDNFSLAEIRQAVEIRDQWNAEVELEVSGNVGLETIRAIAETGVDRISSGALTHQATWLDLGMDWDPGR